MNDVIKAEIDKLETEESFVLIGVTQNDLRISYSNDAKANEIPFSNIPHIWHKKDIGELIKAFSVAQITLPSGKTVRTDEFIAVRTPPYNEALHQLHSLYTKKIIFIVRKTKSETFLNVLRKQKFIVFAKPLDEKQIALDIYIDAQSGFLPAFSDSDAARAYVNCANDETLKQYKPLLMKFSDIVRYKTCIIKINPESYKVMNKDFSFTVTPQLAAYMYKDMLKHMSGLKKKKG